MGAVSVVDLSIGQVFKTYSIGNQPHGADLSDDGLRLFVNSKGNNNLVAID